VCVCLEVALLRVQEYPREHPSELYQKFELCGTRESFKQASSTCYSWELPLSRWIGEGEVFVLTSSGEKQL